MQSFRATRNYRIAKLERAFTTTTTKGAKKDESAATISIPISEPTPEEKQIQLTWRDYDPDGGLPLPSEDLSPHELDKVFSEKIEDPEVGNWILRLMNWRRQSGALIDKQVDFPPEMGVSRRQAYEALMYLRQTYPDFDERSAGVAWAEEQINEVSSEYVARAEKLGLYRRIDNDEQQEDSSPESSDIYGQSQLVEMRRTNEATAKAAEEERLAREQAEEEAELARLKFQPSPEEEPLRKVPGQDPSDELGLGSTASNTATLLRPTQRKAWVKHYEERATLIKDTAPPPISKLRRLVPSFLLTLLVLALSCGLHTLYVPPPTSARFFPDLPPSLTTIATLSATMLLVLIAYRLPPLWRPMNKYFISVPAAPTAISTFLATFTHQQVSHLFWNLILLWSFGRYLHEDVGRGTFLAIFLASGTVGNFAALTSYVLRNKWMTYAFGSSTAVYGVISATCLLRADSDVEVAGFKLPVTGLVLLGGFTVLEVALALRGGKAAKGINFEAHAAGLLAGAGCAGLVRWEVERERRRKEWEKEGEGLMIRMEAEK